MRKSKLLPIETDEQCGIIGDDSEWRQGVLESQEYNREVGLIPNKRPKQKWKYFLSL